MLRGDSLIPDLGINYADLAKQHGFASLHEAELSPTWRGIANRLYRSKLRQILTPKEYAFTMAVTKLQDALGNTSRWRVYGRLLRGSEQIWLVTEFIALSEKAEAWKAINMVKRQTKAVLDVMHEAPNCDHSWKVGPNGEKQEERFGPDHGKMERQVEFSWRVERLTVPEFKRKVRELATSTHVIWTAYGVGVI
jgi:hypothetical protein